MFRDGWFLLRTVSGRKGKPRALREFMIIFNPVTGGGYVEHRDTTPSKMRGETGMQREYSRSHSRSGWKLGRREVRGCDALLAVRWLKLPDGRTSWSSPVDVSRDRNRVCPSASIRSSVIHLSANCPEHSLADGPTTQVIFIFHIMHTIPKCSYRTLIVFNLAYSSFENSPISWNSIFFIILVLLDFPYCVREPFIFLTDLNLVFFFFF